MYYKGPPGPLYWLEFTRQSVLPLKSTIPDLEAYNRIREHLHEPLKPQGDTQIDEHVEAQRDKIVAEVDKLAYRLSYLLYVLKGTNPHLLVLGSGVLGAVDHDFMKSIGHEPKLPAETR